MAHSEGKLLTNTLVGSCASQIDRSTDRPTNSRASAPHRHRYQYRYRDQARTAINMGTISTNNIHTSININITHISSISISVSGACQCKLEPAFIWLPFACFMIPRLLIINDAFILHSEIWVFYAKSTMRLMARKLNWPEWRVARIPEPPLFLSLFLLLTTDLIWSHQLG